MVFFIPSCMALVLLHGFASGDGSAPSFDQEPGDSSADSFLSSQAREWISLQVESGFAASIAVGWTEDGRRGFHSLGAVCLDAEGRAVGPPSEDSIYEIGSISKVFTCLLLALRVQGETMALEDPISDYLPESVSVPGFADQSIRLLDLATHCSSLPRMPPDFIAEDWDDPYRDFGPSQLYEFLAGYTLPRPIGQRMEYSNLGMGLLGLTLALDDGKSYEQMVIDEIAAPLDMSSTGVTLDEEKRGRLAAGHVGRFPASNWSFTDAFAGAGALRSSVRDMLTFLERNLAVSRQVQHESSMDSALALIQEPRADADAPGARIGLGWILVGNGGKEIIWHNGGTGGYRSFAGFVRGGSRGVVVLCNSAASIDDLGVHLLDPSRSLGKPRTVARLDAVTLGGLAGSYRLNPKVVIEVRALNGQLAVQLTGQMKIAAYPISGRRFFLQDVPAEIEFQAGEDSGCEGLVLHQNGVAQHARRLVSSSDE